MTSLKAIAALQRKIPKDIGFPGIIVLRMMFHTEIVRFALGRPEDSSDVCIGIIDRHYSVRVGDVGGLGAGRLQWFFLPYG